MRAKYLRQVPDSLWRVMLIDAQHCTRASCDCVGLTLPRSAPGLHSVIIRVRPAPRPAGAR